jgi:hypothetical protein
MLRKANHGEVVLKEVSEIPEGAREVKCKDFVVVGESETLGNDHRVTVLEDTAVYEKNGILYIKNESPTEVYCPHTSRHTPVELPATIWRVDTAQEYDYLKMEKRNVTD